MRTFTVHLPRWLWRFSPSGRRYLRLQKEHAKKKWEEEIKQKIRNAKPGEAIGIDCDPYDSPLLTLLNSASFVETMRQSEREKTDETH